MKERNLKNYLTALFIKQNKWHNHSVLGHTLKVVWKTIQARQYKMIPTAILHDIGKPCTAFQDEKDLILGTYSFTNHEEASYRIIRNWPISDYTKILVRYHYLLRGKEKAKENGNINKYIRLQRIYDKLDDDLKNDLAVFQKIDDQGK